ncbi:unnamed protein product [Adineta ricciae]|uniref:Uncharacterized protein n=1 Tax=Adineta ricciae TaxID=249248 RepID=A0A814UCV8_ADIRI|nr:unnamed protein product [Adineta ricciae]
MPKESTKSNAISYTIDNPIQIKFFQNYHFRKCVEKHLEQLLSVSITIFSERSAKLSSSYRIYVPKAQENKAEIQQKLSNAVQNLFQTIPSQTFTNEKVKRWLEDPSNKEKHLQCIEGIVDEKLEDVFTVCIEEPKYSLKIYYLSKQLVHTPSNKSMVKLIENKILLEILFLPFYSENSRSIAEESQRLVQFTTACKFRRHCRLGKLETKGEKEASYLTLSRNIHDHP